MRTDTTHTKPAQLQESSLFSLPELGAALFADPAYEKSGQAARTLVREDDLRVLLVALAPGAEIAEHHAKDTASIQVLEGTISLNLNRHTETVSQGGLLLLEKGLPHNVVAQEKALFLLTIGWRQ